MPTYPLPTLAATINENGISAPLYGDILASLQASVMSIYGSDVYIQPDSQDGQLLAIVALAINDANMAMIATYNEFSPATAVGAGLSSVVKINGLAREIPSNSQADLLIVGQAGLSIVGGVAQDNNGFLWDLPSPTDIDDSGQIVVTATCETAGTIVAPAGTIVTIATPTPGWQTVSNIYDAVQGQPVETDAALRLRQAESVALPALTVIDGMNSALAALSGIVRLKTYENDTNVVDMNGIPPHTIAVVVEGGDVGDICQTIALKKTPGCGTYGVVGELVYDQQGVPNFIKFFPLRIVQIFVEVTLTALEGYTSTIGAAIIAQVVAFISALPIGYDVYQSKVVASTELAENMGGLTYDVTSVLLKRQGTFTWDVVGLGWNIGIWDGPFGEGNVTIFFNEAATCITANVALTVVSS